MKAPQFVGSGEDDVEVWIPPSTDCMDQAHRPCPHCGSTCFHHRTGRCGQCGRRPVANVDQVTITIVLGVLNDLPGDQLINTDEIRPLIDVLLAKYDQRSAERNAAREALNNCVEALREVVNTHRWRPWDQEAREKALARAQRVYETRGREGDER